MQQQPASNIKALSILHFSLLTGQLVFAAIAYYLRFSGTMPTVDFGTDPTFIVIGIAAIGAVLTVLAFTMYNKKIAALRDNSLPAAEKMNAYRAASLIRWAMLEAPVLLAIIAFMLTGNYNLLIIMGIILALFIVTRPTIAKAAADLSISESEVNA